MIKEILKFKNGKALDVKYPISLKDSRGNEIYYENSDGDWYKKEYDSRGNETYYEDSFGYWSKREYDSRGNEIYYEDSEGYWSKSEYDSNGNLTYFENSNGKTRGTSTKQETVKKIEELEAQLEKLKKELN